MSETALRRQIRLRRWRLALDGSLDAAHGTIAGAVSRGSGGVSTGAGCMRAQSESGWGVQWVCLPK
jgi:hypothetical protein